MRLLQVDASCRSMTASWVREKAETDRSVKVGRAAPHINMPSRYHTSCVYQVCDFFEGWMKKGTDAELKGN